MAAKYSNLLTTHPSVQTYPTMRKKQATMTYEKKKETGGTLITENDSITNLYPKTGTH